MNGLLVAIIETLGNKDYTNKDPDQSPQKLKKVTLLRRYYAARLSTGVRVTRWIQLGASCLILILLKVLETFFHKHDAPLFLANIRSGHVLYIRDTPIQNWFHLNNFRSQWKPTFFEKWEIENVEKKFEKPIPFFDYPLQKTFLFYTPSLNINY